MQGFAHPGLCPPQDSYLHQFGGSGKNSKGVKETLARHALRSRALEPWFHALSFVVDISPAQAHAIVSQHPSLGQLMAIYADPSRCGHMPCRTHTLTHKSARWVGYLHDTVMLLPPPRSDDTISTAHLHTMRLRE